MIAGRADDAGTLQRRRDMVERQIRARGVRDPRVLQALVSVDRARFVEPRWAAMAYDDCPLSIGEGQTISQPYMVAAMTEALALTGPERVLEIGTGCGYQTAVLAELCAEVYSIERSATLAAGAAERLVELGYDVKLRVGDGTLGWPEAAPFDAILVTAGAPRVPPTLVQQLAPAGGRLVIPVGSRGMQVVQRIVRKGPRPSDLETEELDACRFVDLIGAEGWDE